MGAEAEKVRCLQGIYEVTLRVLLALALPDYLRGPPDEKVESGMRKLGRPSWGDYESLLAATLRVLSRRAEPEPFAPEAAAWYWDQHEKPTGAARLLREVLRLRNYDTHTAAPPRGEGEWRDLRASFERRLRGIQRSLGWLSRYPLLHALQADARKVRGRKLYRMQVQFLMGPEAEPQTTSVEMGDALPTEPSEVVYMARPDGRAFLEVSPFLLFRRAQVETGDGAEGRRPSGGAAVLRERCLLFKCFEEDSRQLRLSDDAHHVDAVCGVPQDGGDQPLDEWLAVRPREDTLHQNHHWSGEAAALEIEPARETICEGYELRGVLGSGGMATVYRAWDEKWHSEVALKVMGETSVTAVSLRRFEQEIELTRKLEHPGIVRIRDRGVTADGRLFYTMDIMEGTSLREMVTREGVPEPKVREWAWQLLGALAFVHAAGVIHRDVKPENCLLDRPDGHGAVRLADFGVARAADNNLTLTNGRSHLGTDRYKSPEQRRGARELGTASDVYSLSLVLHELLRGEVPEEPGVGIEGGFGELLRTMGARVPSDRPTAAAAHARLEQLDLELSGPLEPKRPSVPGAQSPSTPPSLEGALGQFEAMAVIVADDPSDESSWAILEKVAERAGRWDRCAEVVESCLTAEDDALRRRLLERAITIREERLGQRDCAIVLARELAALEPRDAGWDALERLYERGSHLHELAALYLERHKHLTEGGEPRKALPFLVRAGRLFQTHLNDPARAFELARLAFAADGSDTDAARLLESCADSTGGWGDLLPAVVRDFQAEPAGARKRAAGLHIVRWYVSALKRPREALAICEQVLAEEPDHLEALREQIELLRELGRLQPLAHALRHYLDVARRSGREAPSDLSLVEAYDAELRRLSPTAERDTESSDGPGGSAGIGADAAGALRGSRPDGAADPQQPGRAASPLEGEERYSALMEASESLEWSRRYREAVDALTEAARLKPHDEGPLRGLLGLYRDGGHWSKLVDVMQALSDLDPDLEHKAGYMYAIAGIYREQMNNPDDALKFYNRALAFNPTEFDAFAKGGEILAARQDWRGLERAYLAMLEVSAQRSNAKAREFRLLQELGFIYRDRLAQPESALRAFRRASERRPDDFGHRRFLAELAGSSGHSAEAVDHWQLIAQRDPSDPAALRALFDLYSRQRQNDKAWCVASTAVFLLRERAPRDVRVFFERYQGYRVSRSPGPAASIKEEGWLRHLCHPGQSAALGRIFAAMVGAVWRLRAKPLQHFGLREQEAQDPRSATTPLVRSFAQSARALNLRVPLIFFRPQESGMLAFAPSNPIASFCGTGLLSERRLERLAYFTARHLTYYRSDHYVRVLLPTTLELTNLLHAAVKLVKLDHEVPPQVEHLSRLLARCLAEDSNAVEALRTAVDQFIAEGAAADVGRWRQTVELTAVRAGLLLCGDLELVSELMASEPTSPEDLAPAERLKAVVQFSISESYFLLRRQLDVSLP